MKPKLVARQLSERSVALGFVIVIAMLVFGLGVFAGLRVPWGTKQPQVKEGIAMRANSENGLIMFDAADGTQLKLEAGGLWWESGNEEGEGDPPCLRTPQKKVEVEVGYLSVARPSGGSFQHPLWVRCP